MAEQAGADHPRRDDDDNDPARGVQEQALPAAKVNEFVRLLGENQRRISLYVMGLVPNWNDAEEIVQETTVVLWQEFSKFETGTNFAAWACKVAYFRVLAWRKRKTREKLQFSSEFLETISEELAADPERREDRERRLAECVEKLPPDQQKVLLLRYGEGCEIDELATRVGRTVAASYRLLSRIRHNLFECVGRATALENA
jgi:RNA polymerase sigma-70 factor (ECF subfamily)